MSYEKREKRRSLRRKFRISLISFILLYLIFRLTPIIFSNNLKTILTEVDILNEEFQCDGVVIKLEEVFKFDGETIVEKKIDEGVRVPVGADIASLNFSKEISRLKYQIEEIENAIKTLDDKEISDKLLKYDKVGMLKNKEETINKIQNPINTDDFKDIVSLNKNLYSYENNGSEIFENKDLLKASIEDLEERKKILEKKIDENNISYKAEIAGVVSYEIDGYENVFSPDDFENYTYENLDFSGKVELEENFNGFKIMDNFNWYLALKIDDIENINSFKEKDFINIKFADYRDTIDGKIIKINKTGKTAVAILMFRDYFQDYYKIRFSRINILKSSKQAYKIPKTTIIEKNEQKGVYIRDFNGIVKFKPIIIIGEEDDYIFVDKGKSGYIDIPSEKESIKTIGRYDEIFLKPNRIQEGQIVN